MTDARRTLTLTAAALVALAAAFLAGRSSAPERIVERVRTEVVERERVAESSSTTAADIAVMSHTRTESTTTSPDGTVTVTRTDRAEAVREVVRVEVEERIVEREKLVEVERFRDVTRAPEQWRVGLGLGLARDPLELPGVPRYLPVVAGGSVDRRIGGPFWLGVWADSSPAVGVRGSFTF